METIDKIAGKAAELFLKYGIRSVTMDDIAAHLGMAKKTIYKFFENKNALVENFITRETTSNIDNCNMLARHNNDPLLRLFFTMVYARNFYLRLSPLIVHTLEKDHYTSYLILKRYKDGFLFNTIKHSIEEGIALHLYQEDFNVNVMSQFFLESLAIIPESSVLSLKPANTTDQEDVLGHLISGIATPAGLDKINWYKSQHRFTSFTGTLQQPYWED